MILLIILITIIVITIVYCIQNKPNNSNNYTNKSTNYFDDDCGSSQYIEYMKQFTPKQHQAEMDREVKEMWEDITYVNLDD